MNLTPAGRHLLYGTLVSDGAVQHDAVLAVAGGRIAYAGPAAGFSPGTAGFGDAPAPELPPGALILPGLADLHCHGAYGGDFPGGAEAPARRAIDFLHRSGTTTLLASLVTASRESLLHGIALKAGAGLVGLATGTFVVAFLQGSKLKRPSLRLVRGEGVARPRFS